MSEQNLDSFNDPEANFGSLEANLESRKAKLGRLRQRGIDPYPPRFHRNFTAAEAIERFEIAESAGDMADVENVSVAGRIVSMRVMGRAAFLDLRDSSGVLVLQAMLRQNVLGDGFALLPDLDLGDFLGVTGNMIRTRTGQPTIEAHSLTVLAKGMRPLPEKMARPARRRDPLPATVLGSHRQPGSRRDLCAAQPDYQRDPQVP